MTPAPWPIVRSARKKSSTESPCAAPAAPSSTAKKPRNTDWLPLKKICHGGTERTEKSGNQKRPSSKGYREIKKAAISRRSKKPLLDAPAKQPKNSTNKKAR